MAKWSLPVLGYNGIGLRFPVILFGGLSLWLIYSFVKKNLFSNSVAVISTIILALCPVFVHYSHELRGYSSLVFFSICSYYCLFRLLQPKGKTVYWWLLFLSFVGCYLANFAALMFFGALLSTIWILRIVNKFYPNLESLSSFKNISLIALFIYSFFAALFFIWVVFDLDSKVFNQTLDVHTDWGGNYIAIPDIFSTYFGYKYLDDPSSLLYSYPLFIWLSGLFYFSYGIYTLLKKKSFLVPLFLVLCGMTISVYALSGKFIPVRSAIYLLPFIVIFQAYGLKESTLKISIRWFSKDSHRPMYVFVSSYLIGCFFLLTIGKYTNLHANSGNPYELARNYLKNNTGPNDLIISTLYDTVGGFYLGAMIREKNYNIYKNGRIDNIYYLAPKANETKIELEMVYPASKKVKFLPLEKFESVVSYKNKGVRSSEVYVYKRNLGNDQLLHIDQNLLAQYEYFGDYNKTCDKKITEQGIRILCTQSPISCTHQRFTFPNTSENNFQLVLFHHNNDSGTKTSSYATMKSINQSGVDPVPDVFMLNHLVNNIDDTDEFKRNVDLVDITAQKMGDGKNTILCMRGKLFNKHSLIKGIKVFSFGP